MSKDATPTETLVQRGALLERKRDGVKKPLTVDKKVIPYGTMKKSFEELRLMTRDLDLCYNFREQTQPKRERFLKRLLVGWVAREGGHENTVDTAWIATNTNKTLLDQCFRLG